MSSIIIFIAIAIFPRAENLNAGPELDSKINWMSWEEAMAADQQVAKKKFIDLYTDWCGWCKRMDASTFSDPDVVAYINANFYPIKLDAEQKDSIVHDNYIFKYVENGRRGFHELAYSLLNGRMSYPSFVYLDEESKRILISPGFKDTNQMLTELKFLAENYYKTETWESFSQRSN